MNREETKEAIKVMQHYVDGGEVEVKFRHEEEDGWDDCPDPMWNFEMFEYRITPKPKLRPYNAEEFLKAQKERRFS